MEFKSHFDIPEDLYYLNTPGNSLLPKLTAEWRKNREGTFFDPASHMRDKQSEVREETRKTTAQFIGAKPENTFCTPGFSYGFTALLDRLPKDFKFLILDGDYPSLNYPINNRGLPCHRIPMSATIEEDTVIAIERYQPQVLLLSIVQYITGLKIDLQKIKAIKQAYPNLLIIADGTQYIGTEPFAFEASGLDAIAGSGYKWLLSGFGNGFLALSDRLSQLLLREAKDRPMPTETMWAGKSFLQTLFEPGHQDSLSLGSMNSSVSLLQQWGLANIKQHIDELVDFAYAEFAKRNLLLPMIAEREIKSPLINIQVDPSRYDELIAAGIFCFPRGSGIRIGIHLYTEKEDIKQLLHTIDAKETL